MYFTKTHGKTQTYSLIKVPSICLFYNMNNMIQWVIKVMNPCVVSIVYVILLILGIHGCEWIGRRYFVFLWNYKKEFKWNKQKL